jgi:hypothetical protein
MDEVLKGFEAEKTEHPLLVFFGGAEVTGEEGRVLGREGGGDGLGGGGGLFWGGGGGRGHFGKIRWVRRLARMAGKLVSRVWKELV